MRLKDNKVIILAVHDIGLLTKNLVYSLDNIYLYRLHFQTRNDKVNRLSSNYNRIEGRQK